MNNSLLLAKKAVSTEIHCSQLKGMKHWEIMEVVKQYEKQQKAIDDLLYGKECFEEFCDVMEATGLDMDDYLDGIENNLEYFRVL